MINNSISPQAELAAQPSTVEAEKATLPTPREYRDVAEQLVQATSAKDTLLEQVVNSTNGSRETLVDEYNAANRESVRLKNLMSTATAHIMQNTNAVEYQGSLVVLEPAQDRNGKPLIKVGSIYQKNGTELPIKTGTAFDGQLKNAPQDFRKAMYAGPFVVGLDGTLDVTERYDQIPFTE
jgi:hypothetical protein